jgi:HEPN superfamily RiboL-PSP-like protein
MTNATTSNQVANKMVAAFIKRQVKRTVQNLKRADKLVALYQSQYRPSQARHFAYETDLLRAAVVFTHASLEDFMRSVLRAFLPWADEGGLENVPLAGTQGRAQKFPLGELAKHRNKTVQELLQQSVDEYLERSSYNSPNEILRVLAAIKIDLRAFDPILRELGAMIKRRHAIVHRADTAEIKGKRHVKPTPLEPETVQKWIQATSTFVLLVFGRLPVTRFKRTGSKPATAPDPAEPANNGPLRR